MRRCPADPHLEAATDPLCVGKVSKGETRLRLALNFLVPGTGVEPARLAALDPKSSASANSAIPAIRDH